MSGGLLGDLGCLYPEMCIWSANALIDLEIIFASTDRAWSAVRLGCWEGPPLDVGLEATRTTSEYGRSKTFIYCLAARRDNPLLWSHYTAGHTGVCLHFGCRPGTLFGLARKIH
jgi:hypothetical protein